MRNEYKEESPKEKSSPVLKIFAIGCLSIILMGAIAIYWVSQNYKGLMAGGAGMLIEIMVNETPLPEQEKKEVMVPINNFISQYKSGKISDEEATAVLEKLGEGAIFQTIALRLFEVVHIENSALPDEAKQIAKTTLSRYRQAFLDKILKSNEGQLNTISDIITYKEEVGGQNKTQFKKSLTEEELQQCLKIMKIQADEAEIPLQYFEVRLGDLIQKAIDNARAEAAKK